MTLSEPAHRLKKAILEQFVFEDDASLAILDSGIQAFDLMSAAQAQVVAEGLTVPGDRGGKKAHPLLSVVRDARSGFLQAMKALRLEIGADEKVSRGPGRPTWYESMQQKRKGAAR